MTPATTTAELLPCPWCGNKLSRVSVSEGSTFRWRKVDGCCTDGPEIRHHTLDKDQAAAEIDSTARAIAAWNTRAQHCDPQAGWRDTERLDWLISRHGDGYEGIEFYSHGRECDDTRRAIDYAMSLDAIAAALGAGIKPP